MSGECPICGECSFECTCDKSEKHFKLKEKHRQVIRDKLAEMFKTGIPSDCIPCSEDSETAQEDQDLP
jgi:hypothetical protein